MIDSSLAPRQKTLFERAYHIGNIGVMSQIDIAREWDDDPRGFVMLWEKPESWATYVMGIDPTYGITGWDRSTRVDRDKKINNGAIEIIRVGGMHFDGANYRKARDVQVAEFAAPVDPYDLAYIANNLGRLFAGNDESGQCPVIIEVYPGPGSNTQQKLIELNYTNLWMSTKIDRVQMPGASPNYGWKANSQSLQALWVRSSRHLINDRIEVNSPFLVEELADAVPNDKDYVESPNNQKGHGDRMRAFCLALWAANEWDTGKPDYEEIVTIGPPIPLEFTDKSMEEIEAHWQNIFDRAGVAW